MTADVILSIKEPELLFSSDMSAAKREFRVLVMNWHPDRNKDPKAMDQIGNDYARDSSRFILDGSVHNAMPSVLPRIVSDICKLPCKYLSFNPAYPELI